MAPECCFCDPIYTKSEVIATKDVIFGSARNVKTGESESLLLNIYEPPTSDLRVTRPIAISIHGGGFVSGNHNKATAVRWGQFFAMRGYVAASIDYRLEAKHWPPPEKYPYIDALFDAKAAVRYMVKNAHALRLDTDRVAVFGSSAGGVLSYMLGMVQSEGEGDSGSPGYASNITAFASLSGELPPMFLDEMHVGSAPFVEIHGTKDGAVPYANATATKSLADELGVDNLFYTLPGAGHVPWAALEGNASMMFGVFEFLSSRLRLPTKGIGCPTDPVPTPPPAPTPSGASCRFQNSTTYQDEPYSTVKVSLNDFQGCCELCLGDSSCVVAQMHHGPKDAQFTLCSLMATAAKPVEHVVSPPSLELACLPQQAFLRNSSAATLV